MPLTLTDELEATALVWSACGADTNLRVNTSFLVQTNSRMDQAMGTVDSADISAGRATFRASGSTLSSW